LFDSQHTCCGYESIHYFEIYYFFLVHIYIVFFMEGVTKPQTNKMVFFLYMKKIFVDGKFHTSTLCNAGIPIVFLGFPSDSLDSFWILWISNDSKSRESAVFLLFQSLHSIDYCSKLISIRLFNLAFHYQH